MIWSWNIRLPQIISGPTWSGKSFWVRFLQNINSLCTEKNFDGGIIWCYSERTAVPDRELSKISNNIRLNKGVQENFENKNGKPCLIKLDDQLDFVYSKEVCNLFRKGSHHRNISVILITQKLFHQGQLFRDISLNAKYLVLLKKLGIVISLCAWPVKYILKVLRSYRTHI